jgi:hypothetical protein
MKKTFKKKEGRRIKRKRKTLKRRGGEGEKNSFFSKITNKASDFSAYAKDSIQARLPRLSPRNKGEYREGDDGFSFVEPRPSLEHVIHLGAMPDQTKESLQGKTIDEIILKLKAESNDYLFNREMKLLDRDQIQELPIDIIVRWLDYIRSDTDNKSVRQDYTDAIGKISLKQVKALDTKFLVMESRLDNRFGGKSRNIRKQKRTLKRGRR